MSTDVMTNPKTTTKEKKRISTKVIAQIGVLGAIAMVLMLFDIPLPFAPTFYKIDFSEVPVLIGAFTMGPVETAFRKSPHSLSTLCSSCEMRIPSSLSS